MNPNKQDTAGTPMRAAWRACAGYFLAALLFSMAINALFLTSPLYMLQVYDRVLSSRSEATLAMLTLAALVALLTLAVLDDVRARVLIRAGLRLDARLSSLVYARQVERSSVPNGGPRHQLMTDLDTFRQFITGNGIHAMFDAPWMPFYLAIIYLFDPLLGTVALLAALLLLGLAVANEYATAKPLKRANELAFRNYGFTDATLRNAEAIQAMGMLDNLLGRWRRDRLGMLAEQARASDRGAAFSAAIKFFRLFLQSGMLGAGAWLVIEGRITPGVMFAASILMGRALAPVEQVVGVWRPFSAARASFARINRLFLETPEREAAMALPRPQGRLSVEGVSYAPPGSERMTLRNLNFVLEPGEALGIVGPSAAGKSTLARLMVGVWKPHAGAVRLDGANVYTWNRTDFGRHVGYLPQDIELFGGSIRDNIARFGDADPEAVVAAAQAAGVHEMILRLPRGYETEIGEAGGVLSGGQRQRIGLARALYGDPQLVILDEPNSNLDTDGEEALRRLLADLKQRSVTVVIIAHRPSVLSSVDKIMVLRDGAIELFAPRNEAMARLVPGAVAAHPAAAPAQR